MRDDSPLIVLFVPRSACRGRGAAVLCSCVAAMIRYCVRYSKRQARGESLVTKMAVTRPGAMRGAAVGQRCALILSRLAVAMCLLPRVCQRCRSSPLLGAKRLALRHAAAAVAGRRAGAAATLFTQRRCLLLVQPLLPPLLLILNHEGLQSKPRTGVTGILRSTNAYRGSAPRDKTPRMVVAYVCVSSGSALGNIVFIP